MKYSVCDEKDNKLNKIKEFLDDMEAKTFALNESKKRGVTLLLVENSTGEVISSFGLLID